MCGCSFYYLCEAHNKPAKFDKCDITYCDQESTRLIEVRGFHKQYMCEKHAESLYKALKPEYAHGMELLG